MATKEGKEEIVKTSDIEIKVKTDDMKADKKVEKKADDTSGFFSWPLRRETEQTVYHEVYRDSDLSNKKAMAEMSKRMKDFKKIKWKIIIPFVILSIAVVVSLLVSLYAAIGSLPTSRANQLEKLVMEETSRLSDTFNTLEPQLAAVLQLNRNFTAIVSLGQSSSNPIRSCSVLPAYYPPGNYYITGADGSSTLHYCTTLLSCYGGTGAWAKVAELNMSNRSHQCPDGLREHTKSGIRTCVRVTTDPICSSGVQYNMAGIEFSRVCGKIIGYQVGHTNAFLRRQGQDNNDPGGFYVDGVSLTHGSSSTHIWTFASALDDSLSSSTLTSKCGCSVGEPASEGNSPPQFVGEDYFCDSGNRGGTVTSGQFMSDDPLWDGAGCGSSSTCCRLNTPPWFFRQLREPTSEYIEMRLCSDELSVNEDIAIESVELYIQ